MDHAVQGHIHRNASPSRSSPVVRPHGGEGRTRVDDAGKASSSSMMGRCWQSTGPRILLPPLLSPGGGQKKEGVSDSLYAHKAHHPSTHTHTHPWLECFPGRPHSENWVLTYSLYVCARVCVCVKSESVCISVCVYSMCYSV